MADLDRIREALDIVYRAKMLGNYDSNVVGMAGEVIAEEALGMQKASAGMRNIDGHRLIDGTARTVQVKSWSSTRVARYGAPVFCTMRADQQADDLVVILVYCEEREYEVLYDGPSTAIGQVRSQGTRYVRLDDLAQGDRLEEIVKRCTVRQQGLQAAAETLCNPIRRAQQQKKPRGPSDVHA
jgi:hypothetical protein